MFFCGLIVVAYIGQTCCIDSATANNNGTIVMLHDVAADDYAHMWATAAAASRSKHPD